MRHGILPRCKGVFVAFLLSSAVKVLLLDPVSLYFDSSFPLAGFVCCHQYMAYQHMAFDLT